MTEQPTHNILFVPGPTEVRPEIRAAMARPLIGHRGSECKALVGRLREKLQPIFATKTLPLFETCPATAVMEAAIRNLVAKRVLVCTCGAFSERWRDIALSCGREADALAVAWGKPNATAELDRALASGAYDAVTITHNETSTGVINPLAELAAVAHKHGVLVLVDAVSSLAGAPVDFDANALDFCFAGSQKCLALPPGVTVYALSPRALERAKQIPNRGWILDFVRATDGLAKGETSATPSIPHLFALELQLDTIATETMPVRYARHRAMAARIQQWAASKGLEMFPDRTALSPTVSTINVGKHDGAKLLADVKKKGFVVSDGYGKLKGVTFRIGHMGDHTLDSLNAMLAAFLP